MLGYTGAVSREELEGSDGEFANDAEVGKSGIELVYEDLLRKDPGQRTYSVDAQGRIVDADQQVASEEERERIEASATEEPVPGTNLRLSLDLDLQRTVEEELERAVQAGQREGYASSSGASVVLDPETGGILAMASYPGSDPQLFVGGISGSGEIAEYEAPVSGSMNSAFTEILHLSTAPRRRVFGTRQGGSGLPFGSGFSRFHAFHEGASFGPFQADSREVQDMSLPTAPSPVLTRRPRPSSHLPVWLVSPTKP